MISTKLRRHRDAISCHAPGARDLAGGLVRGPVQLLARPAALLDALHALHWLRLPLGQPGHAQRRRSLAPDAPALEPEEAALVVAQLSAEQTEAVTGCG